MEIVIKRQYTFLSVHHHIQGVLLLSTLSMCAFKITFVLMSQVKNPGNSAPVTELPQAP